MTQRAQWAEYVSHNSLEWSSGVQTGPDDPMAREREKDAQALELYACWQEEQRKQQARKADDEERDPPVEHIVDIAAEAEAERAADRHAAAARIHGQTSDSSDAG